MSDSVNVMVADQLPASDARLDEERARALETIAQNLRQPLIDQLNWCDLLTTDTQHSLHATHLEWVAKINRTANDLLAQVQDLLDEEKIQDRVRAAEQGRADAQADGTSAPESIVASPDAMPAEAPRESLAEVEAVEVVAAPPCALCFHAPPRLETRVLVVEGVSTIRDMLVGALRPTFHVLTAADGWDALQMMAERPDVMVANVSLERVEFLDMVDHARQIMPNLPVLALHDARDQAWLPIAQRRGVRAFLQKPFSIAAVVEQVEALAASRPAPANKSVLIACPDPHEGNALYHLLDARYRTLLAPSRAVAENAAGDHFDVLLVDATGPDQWWKDIVPLCRGANGEMRLLALVDGRDRSVIGALRESRADAAIRKPYSCKDLLSQLRHLLGIKDLDGGFLRSVLRKAVI